MATITKKTARKGSRHVPTEGDDEIDEIDEERAQAEIDQLLEQSTFPFYMILATNQDKVYNPAGGFRKYANKQHAIDQAKKYIRNRNLEHESFLVIEAKVSAVVGFMPEDIPVTDIEELRQKQLAKGKDED